MAAGAGPALGLVGRARELTTVLDRIERPTGRSAAIELIGEAGIGKTSLLRAAAGAARQRGHEVLWVGATEAEAELPWAGLASVHPSFPEGVLDQLVDVQRAAVLAAVGEAAPTVSSAGPYVAAALRNILTRLAADGPVLLVADDVHWLDAATAGALAVAIRGTAELPVVSLTAWRDDLTPRIELGRIVDHDHHVVRPTTLDATEVHQLLRQCLDMRLSQTVVDRVTRLSGGNPLSVTLLAEHLRDGGAVDTLPRSIAGSYAELLDALAPPTLGVLEHAAVLGRPDRTILEAACERYDVLEELHTAQRHGLVTGRADELEFVHPLLPATLLERLGPLGRERIHRRLAAVVSDPELGAVHLAAAATKPDAAIADALEFSAGAGALARGARIEAGRRFERAEELTPRRQVEARWRRALAAADAYLGGGDPERATAQATIAAALAEGEVQVAMAGGVLVQVVASRDGLHPAHDLVCDLLDRLEGHPVLQSFLARARVRIEQTFDVDAALGTALASQAALEAVGEQRLAEQLSVVADNCRFVLGRPVDAIATWELARPDADPTDPLGAGWLAVELLVWDHHVDAAVAALDQFERVSDERGNMLVQFNVNDFRAGLEARRGNLDVAERELRKAIDAAALTGYPASMAAPGLARILAATGRHAEAATTLAAVEAPPDDLPMLVAAYRVGAGGVAMAAGRWDDAVEHLQAAWSAAEKVGMGDLRALPFRPDLVEALTRVGRVADAAVCAERIEELAAGCAAPTAQLFAGRARLLVLVAEGRYPDAVELGQALVDESRRLELPIDQARILLTLGTALRRAGRRRDAAAVLADGRGLAAAMGLVPLVELIDAEAARLGGRRDPYELTSTEARIAALVALGRSNKDVARELFVSLRTVESNLTRIYRKLGVRSRAELAAGYRPSAGAGPP